MLQNYLKVALRNLRKRKGYTSINVFGLGVGIAASLLIVLFAWHELSYDRFHEHADRVYQVYKERITPTGTQITRDTWVPLLARLERTYPSVERGVRFWSTNQWVQRKGERFQEQITYTDAPLFEVLTFPLERGDPATALRDPYSAVITQAMAQKYFGDADPLGKVLTIDHDREYTVRGVFEAIPSNTVFDIDIAVPLVSDPQYEEFQDEWGRSFLGTFILLDEEADPAALEAQFPAFIADIWDEEVASRTNFKLEALPDLYHATTGNRVYAYILLGIAAAILLIACINFINLSTARSMERAREVGMRKVLGAQRVQLVRQFLGEAMLMGLLALALGVALVQALLPGFNELYDVELALHLWRRPLMLVGLLGLGLAIGGLSGGYPAMFLARFQPIESLRGTREGRSGGRRLRQGLVIVQFALSMVLIAGTLVVWQQVQHMKNADLGFNKEQVLVLPVELDDFADPEAAAVRLETFKDELAQQSDVRAVTSSSHVPGQWGNSFVFARPEGGDPEQPARVRWAAMDAQFFPAYGIDFAEGRNFIEGSEADQQGSLIVNEAARQDFGWETGVGKTIRVGSRTFDVVGVVRNYNFQSLENAVAPILHLYRPPDGGAHNFISARIQSSDYGATLETLRQHWQQLDPTRPFNYTFADDSFAQLYETQDRLVRVAGAFAVLAVLIACLGLFGLASLMVAQRTKEIGIRKVLGASVSGIVLLLSKDFTRLVLVAFVVAVPVAYGLMTEWLQSFAYRIEISWLIFLVTGLTALGIAWLTVSYQAIKAALTDPVKALRYE